MNGITKNRSTFPEIKVKIFNVKNLKSERTNCCYSTRSNFLYFKIKTVNAMNEIITSGKKVAVI